MSGYDGCAPIVTPRAFAAITVSRMVVASPPWKPHAMFADDTRSSSASSSARRDRPKPSPRSAFRSIVRGKELFLAALFPAAHRLCFDDLPVFPIVLEAPARDFREELFAHDDRRQPVGVSIIPLDGEPGELRAHSLIADF